MTELAELYRIAEEQNIAVDRFALKRREALSYMDLDGSCYIAIDPDKLKGELDEKMKISHEMGHCFTGSFYNKYAVCDVRRKHEHRADKWAIQKLVPVDDLDNAVADGHTELWDLAEHFGVTEDFMRKVVCWYTYGNLATNIYF